MNITARTTIGENNNERPDVWIVGTCRLTYYSYLRISILCRVFRNFTCPNFLLFFSLDASANRAFMRFCFAIVLCHRAVQWCLGRNPRAVFFYKNNNKKARRGHCVSQLYKTDLIEKTNTNTMQENG